MWYAFAEEAITSWAYAGAAAHLAYCYELAGAPQTDIDKWILESETEYSWAESKSPGNPGEEFIRQKYYAAAALYRVTGDHKYLDDFKECRSWYYLDNNNGTYVFCLTPPDKWGNLTTEDETLQNSLKSTIRNLAYDQGLNQASERALRFIKYSNPNMSWGGYYPHIMMQMVYHHLSDDDDVLNFLYTTADMYLGANNDQQVFITGAKSVTADRVLRDILHIDSNYDGIPGWIPGIPPYKYTSSVYNPSFFIEPSDPHDWPMMEQCIDSRDYIPASEFTVQETVTPMAALFSYLKAYSSGKNFIISFDKPDPDSVYAPGSDVPVAVTASVSEGSISKVEFYSGTTKLGEDTSAPYEYTLSNLAAGIYSVSAIAYSESESRKSKSIRVVVDDQPPTDPSNLIVTGIGSLSIDLAWDASTDDAGVKEYEVYVDDQLWTSSILPECTVDGLNADTRYFLYIKAIDYAGKSSDQSNVVDTITKPGKFVPGLIQAEDFDNVVGDVSWEASGDVDSTDYVGWFDEGESLEYAANIESTDDYLVTFRVARGADPGDFEFYEGSTLLKSIFVPNTGGWGKWADVIAIVHLDAGQQSLIIKNVGNPINFNWMNFEVTIPTQGVMINNCPADSLEEGGSYTMSATVSPADASDTTVTWSSSNEGVATIDANGNITALAEGTTDIVVSTNFGDHQTICQVTVYRDRTGIKDIGDSGLSIYPNPVQNGTLTLKGTILVNSRVILTDINGRIVLEKNNKNGSAEVSLNVSELNPGFYFIRVVNSQTSLTRKLIVR